jgi:hypothetical protein
MAATHLKTENEKTRQKTYEYGLLCFGAREVLKLTVEGAKILISTAKIAKGCERSSVFWRIFASFRG